MRLVLRRALLAILLLGALVLGIWAYFWPRSFYDSFPGLGMRWLVQSGPYNEHFVTDIGGMYLALAVLAAGGIAFAGNDSLVRVVALAWTVFNVVHLVYHIRMIGMYDGRDKVLVIGSLSMLVVVSLALLAPIPRSSAARTD